MKRLYILLLVLTVQGIFAQQEIMPTAPRGYIQSGACMQMWRQKIIIEQPIIQVAFPVHLVIPVNSSLNLNIDYTYSRTDWDMRKTSMSGFSDPYVQGNLLLWDNKLMIMGGLGVPMGKTRLNYDEFLLSQYLSLNLFQFRQPVYGQGLHGKLGAFVAYPLMHGVVLGGGTSFLYRRKFVPIDWVDSYFDPGEEINMHLGLDWSLGENMKFMIDGIFTYFQKDKYTSPEYVFHSGIKYTVNGGYFYRYDEQYLWALFNYRSKNRNSALQALEFKEENYNTNNAQLDVNVIWKAFNVQGGGVHVLLDGRFYGENEVGLSWAKLVGGGFGGEYRFSYTTVIEFYVKYLVGQRMSSSNFKKLNIEGLDIAILFRYEF